MTPARAAGRARTRSSAASTSPARRRRPTTAWAATSRKHHGGDLTSLQAQVSRNEHEDRKYAGAVRGWCSPWWGGRDVEATPVSSRTGVQTSAQGLPVGGQRSR